MGVETQQAWVQRQEMYKLKLIVVLLAALSAAEENISSTEAEVTTTITSVESLDTTSTTTAEKIPTTTTGTVTEEQETTALPQILRQKLSDEDKAWVLSIKGEKIQLQQLQLQLLPLLQLRLLLPPLPLLPNNNNNHFLDLALNNLEYLVSCQLNP